MVTYMLLTVKIPGIFRDGLADYTEVPSKLLLLKAIFLVGRFFGFCILGDTTGAAFQPAIQGMQDSSRYTGQTLWGPVLHAIFPWFRDVRCQKTPLVYDVLSLECDIKIYDC